MKSLGWWSALTLGGVLGAALAGGGGAPDAEEAAILREVKAPAGYDVTVFARPPLVNYPVFVAAAPGGDLYVSSDKNGSLDRAPHRGSVVRLRDTDGDGRADQAKKFVADVDTPRGLVWDHDRLYLMHPPHLSVFIDHDGDGVADEERVLVKNIAFTFKDRPGDHTSNGVTLGIDGWLYLAIGDFGFMQAEGADGTKLQLRGGGVVRVRPDGTGLELVSRGTRNILEVGLTPSLDAFARDNTNDGGGWDVRLHHATGLGEHGYPSLFQHFADEILAPLADYGGGAGCGACYVSEPGFPKGDGDALYTADWGRSTVYRHHPTPKGATFTIDQAPFLSLPRVTDLDVDARSRLYVASWKGATFTYAGENVGYIVRLAPRGYRPEPLPDFAKASDAELVKLLESPSHRRRLEAQRALLRHGLKADTIGRLEAVAEDSGKAAATRIAALFALKQGLGEKATPLLVRLAADEAIRPYALRALTDRKDQLAGVPAPILVGALRDPSARVRRQAAESVARLGQVGHAAALTPLLADPDPVVAHTAGRALMALGAADACFAVLDRTDAPAAARAGAIRVLQSLHRTEVVDGLVRRLEQESDPARRHGLITGLCRLYAQEGPWKGNSWGTRPDTSGPYYQPETWAGSDRIGGALKGVVDRLTPAEAPFVFAELNRHRVPVEGAADKLVAMAQTDAALLPVLVAQVARGGAVPARAIDLLAKAAVAPASPPAVRAQAVTGLVKADRPDALRAALAAVATLEKAARAEPEFAQARDALLGAAKLGRHLSLLQEEAARLDGAASRWADAVLVALAGRKSKGPSDAMRAVEAAWASPPRRVQLLEAMRLARAAPIPDQVLAARADPDLAVAAAARRTVSELRLDQAARKGPLVGSLSVDAALAAAVKQKGDPVLGERLFAQLQCVNCHTVKEGEPLRGPFLGNIASTYKRRELAEAVLLPSKTIAQGFTTNVFVLDDGRTLIGFVVQEAADKVTVRDGTGKETAIPVARIEERGKSPVSVMPEGLVRDLTVREFASVLDYLEALARKK